MRDLSFPCSGTQFTIPLIKDYLDKLGLKFCGFEASNSATLYTTNKAKNDPYDLNKWQAFEEANPNAFAGMYQFWCQKVTGD